MESFVITRKFVIRLCIAIVTILLLYVVRDVLALVFISVIISASISPLVDYLEKHRAPRPISVICVLIGFVLALYLILQSIIPNLINQIEEIIPVLNTEVPRLLNNLNVNSIGGNINVANQIVSALTSWIGNASGNVVQLGFGVLDFMISTFTVIVLTYYITVEQKEVKHFFATLLSGTIDARRFERLWNTVKDKLGIWVRGQLLVMILVGLATYVGLMLAGVEFALPLAILAGLLEIIPFIGPSLAALPGLLIAFADSPIKALWALVVYFSIQQIESALIVPRVMNSAVGLNPIVVIIAVMIGNRLGGILGTIISVPIAAILLIVFEEWRKDGQKRSVSKPLHRS